MGTSSSRFFKVFSVAEIREVLENSVITQMKFSEKFSWSIFLRKLECFWNWAIFSILTAVRFRQTVRFFRQEQELDSFAHLALIAAGDVQIFDRKRSFAIDCLNSLGAFCSPWKGVNTNVPN